MPTKEPLKGTHMMTASQFISIRDWSKTMNLCLTRSVAQELGQIATKIADKRKQPLLVETSEDGTRRNQYPEFIIKQSWLEYEKVNQLCPEVPII